MASVLNPSALTTLATLEELLGITGGTASIDNKLERIINRASDWIEDATGRKLKARNYNGLNESGGSDFATTAIASEDYLYFSGDQLQKGGDTLVDAYGRGYVYLPQYPIQTASPALAFSLHVLSNRVTPTWDTTSLVENRDYVINRQSGELKLLGAGFQPGVKNYRVKCTAGYLYGSAQPYVPGGLEELCIEKAKQFLKADPGIQSESIGTWSRSYNADASQERIDELVSLFKRYPI